MEPENNNCTLKPNIVFLMVTLLVTATATAILCASIMTQNWEYVTWDTHKLRALEKEVMVNTSSEINMYGLEWLFDDQVARVVLDLKHYNDNLINASQENVTQTENPLPALFFVPVRGGIWTFCIVVTDKQQKQLEKLGFPKTLCTNYLKIDTARGSLKTDRQHRMQNLSISCALVCLIILGSSALTGVFGITKHQISAVLITGVMYLLAAIFAIFSLTIINFKRAQGMGDCFNRSTTNELTAEGVVISKVALEKPYSLKKVNRYFDARVFSTGWSLHLGWGGAGMCILVSILWILLSKIMRYNPISTLLMIL